MAMWCKTQNVHEQSQSASKSDNIENAKATADTHQASTYMASATVQIVGCPRRGRTDPPAPSVPGWVWRATHPSSSQANTVARW